MGEKEESRFSHLVQTQNLKSSVFALVSLLIFVSTLLSQLQHWRVAGAVGSGQWILFEF